MPKHLENFPLHPERNEIRLLTILPSTKAESITRCSLKSVSLDNSPEFEAISYVWGDASKKTDIIINDTLFYVTRSVDKTLRLLRRKYRRRVVWIDFVCINQHDVPEKNTQVPLLGRVYESASAVIAMMVNSNMDLRAAISWTKACVPGRITQKTGTWRVLDKVSRYHDRYRDLRAMRLLNAYEQFRLTRMWTYQEYQLANCYPIRMSGTLTFNAYLMLSFARESLVKAYWNDQEIQEAFRRRYGEAEFRKLWLLHGPTERSKDESALYHFHKTWHRQCKDPRDKVYALYSLLPSLQTKYPPDYNKPVEQVMHETTAYIVTKCPRALSSFRLWQGNHSPGFSSSYPSWILDFGCAAEPLDAFLGEYGWYSDARVPLPTTTDDLSTMTICARRIGSCFPVVQLASTMPDIIDQFVSITDVRYDTWGGLESRRLSLVHACLAYTHLHTKFTHNLSAKTTGTFHLLHEIDIHRASNPWWQELLDDPIVEGFGISGPNVQQGDVAVMALGVHMPLILRPYWEDNGIYYRLVDRAYIPLMSEIAILQGMFDDARFLERPPQVFSSR
ncbi:HET domain protein [Aspergillus eucalypticola CBS 122712]|uniref:HET domain protein n=1 Tax=Aspergillus eucalypticola (strain CBS 122712 / IBT 29274) TaxID=1448314 RepID=A0A317UTV7_ASPEC|nr:HET domain protein [Aspergillus eucalypticola CBS 122712]PWY64799.1 HET domain protein [Aspergillus eucalypticola CBS 122712]